MLRIERINNRAPLVHRNAVLLQILKQFEGVHKLCLIVEDVLRQDPPKLSQWICLL